MNKNVFIVVAALIVIALITFSYKVSQPSKISQVKVTPTATPTPFQKVGKSIVVSLNALNNSKQSGTATVSQLNDSILVTVQLNGMTPDSKQDVSILSGSCSATGAAKYPLTTLFNGASTIVLDVTYADFLKQLPLSVKVFKSENSTTPVSCGQFSK